MIKKCIALQHVSRQEIFTVCQSIEYTGVKKLSFKTRFEIKSGVK